MRGTKPSLYVFKKDVGKRIENPKTEVHFVIVDTENNKDYPLNFVCVLPKCLINTRSAFRKIFGEENIPIAKRLLSNALRKESDSEIKSEIRKRLKMIHENNIRRTQFANLRRSL